MSAGWVLVQTSEDNVPEVVGALRHVPGVEAAEQTVGAYDVVVRVADPGDAAAPAAKRVARTALRIPGVTLAVCCQPGAAAAEGRTIDVTETATGPLAAGPGMRITAASPGALAR